jgi:hypothetical protein
MRKEPETLRDAQRMLKKYGVLLEEAKREARAGKRNKTILNRIKKAFDYYTEIIPKMTQERKSYAKISKMRTYSHDANPTLEPTHMVVPADDLEETEVDNTPLFIGTKRQCQAYIDHSKLITLKIKKYGRED